MKYYAGIGSRETPERMLAFFSGIAYVLNGMDYCLRSGGADGADLAFERGATDKEIFLPWKNFNKNKSLRYDPSDDARAIAETIHPAWHNLTRAGKLLHTRNVHQILGYDLTKPVDFVLCWTKDGKGQGGTRTAIELAKQHNIPVHDFGTGDLNWSWVLNGNVDSDCEAKALSSTMQRTI